jgi:hypothetical protein
MVLSLNRRLLLQGLLAGFGGFALAAAGSGSVWARPSRRIARLIDDVRAPEHAGGDVAARIAFISRGLLGTRYRANTLIGGPNRPEQFVVRDDAFDCVTYCETVLAASLARDYDDFERTLQTIRYANGVVRWDERNHYFADWCRRAIEKNICRAVELPKTVTIDKTVNWDNFGRRQVSMRAIPTESLLARPSQVANGDIIGFVSRRANLDFFHTGFVMLGPKRDVFLRHASQSRGRVLDEPMARFVAANRVQNVTLLRALEPPTRVRGA